jgi:hypothetical protein
LWRVRVAGAAPEADQSSDEDADDEQEEEGGESEEEPEEIDDGTALARRRIEPGHRLCTCAKEHQDGEVSADTPAKARHGSITTAS